jgi:hypothetical protein
MADDFDSLCPGNWQKYNAQPPAAAFSASTDSIRDCAASGTGL